MKPKMTKMVLVTGGVTALLTVQAQAQSADALLDKLVEKGILTVQEANELREESDKGFNSALQAKTGMPDWVTSFRLGGDMRGRFEHFASGGTFDDRYRFRYRLRAGAIATIQENFEVGFRLTSSEARGTFGGDPISGNTSFQDNGSKKFVYIDQAYGKWTPVNGSFWTGSLTLGKMENPFVFSDMVFDGDYTPEGFAQQAAFNLTDTQNLKLNLGQFVLDEAGDIGNDPFLLGAQVRMESAWTKKVSTSAGVGALLITSEEALDTPSVPDVNRGNTRTAGALNESYNPLIADAAVIYMVEAVPGYNAAFPVRFGGEYMNNPAAESQGEAYSVGVTFGKSGKKGLWELGYRWKHLEADAWYEELVDSDFGALGAGGGYEAGTNVEGHIVKAAYSPNDSFTIGMTYFLTERIRGVAPAVDHSMSRLQVDAIWKF